MATTVKEGNFIYRINPDKPTELQRATMGSNSWSFVCGCNGAQIFDIITRAVISSRARPWVRMSVHIVEL